MLVRLPVLDLLAARRKPDQDAVNPDPDTIATRIHALIEGLASAGLMLRHDPATGRFLILARQEA